MAQAAWGPLTPRFFFTTWSIWVIGTPLWRFYFKIFFHCNRFVGLCIVIVLLGRCYIELLGRSYEVANTCCFSGFFLHLKSQYNLLFTFKKEAKLSRWFYFTYLSTTMIHYIIYALHNPDVACGWPHRPKSQLDSDPFGTRVTKNNVRPFVRPMTCPIESWI